MTAPYPDRNPTGERTPLAKPAPFGARLVPQRKIMDQPLTYTCMNTTTAAFHVRVGAVTDLR